MSLYHQAALAVPSDGSNLMQLSKEFLEEEKETILQYPQTGRTSCNLLDMPVCRSSQILAVPSDGSNLMQLITCSSATFIIELAVPSDGSNLMQPTLPLCWMNGSSNLQYPQTGRTSCNNSIKDAVYGTAYVLQYPQTGRTSCNGSPTTSEMTNTPLAVPSDGSNLMQPAQVYNNKPSGLSCSTLRRVEPHATHCPSQRGR